MNDTNTSPLTFIIFFVLIAISTQSCAAGGNSLNKSGRDEWKIVKAGKGDKPNWTIYRRKIVGTDFQEYKIEGVLESSPQDCISWFKEDIHRLANGSEPKKYLTYEIVDESEDSLLIYAIHDEPWPLKDTEMSMRYTFFEKDGTAGVRWHEAWDESQVPPSKKLSRVETFRGSWSFSSVSDNAFQALNSVTFNPRKMPRWLFQPMVSGLLKKGLERMRNSTSD